MMLHQTNWGTLFSLAVAYFAVAGPSLVDARLHSATSSHVNSDAESLSAREIPTGGKPTLTAFKRATGNPYKAYEESLKLSKRSTEGVFHLPVYRRESPDAKLHRRGKTPSTKTVRTNIDPQLLVVPVTVGGQVQNYTFSVTSDFNVARNVQDNPKSFDPSKSSKAKKVGAVKDAYDNAATEYTLNDMQLFGGVPLNGASLMYLDANGNKQTLSNGDLGFGLKGSGGFSNVKGKTTLEVLLGSKVLAQDVFSLALGAGALTDPGVLLLGASIEADTGDSPAYSKSSKDRWALDITVGGHKGKADLSLDSIYFTTPPDVAIDLIKKAGLKPIKNQAGDIVAEVDCDKGSSKPITIELDGVNLAIGGPAGVVHVDDTKCHFLVQGSKQGDYPTPYTLGEVIFLAYNAYFDLSSDTPKVGFALPSKVSPPKDAGKQGTPADEQATSDLVRRREAELAAELKRRCDNNESYGYCWGCDPHDYHCDHERRRALESAMAAERAELEEQAASQLARDVDPEAFCDPDDDGGSCALLPARAEARRKVAQAVAARSCNYDNDPTCHFSNEPFCDPYDNPTCADNGKRSDVVNERAAPVTQDVAARSCNYDNDPTCHFANEPFCDPHDNPTCADNGKRSDVVTERATQACDPEKQECGSDEEPDCDPLQDPDCLSHSKRSLAPRGTGPYGCDPGDSGCIAFKGVPSCNPYTGQNCHPHDPPKEVDPPATCDPSTGRNCHPHERSDVVTKRATQACDPEKEECGSDEDPDCDPLQDPDCLSHPKRSLAPRGTGPYGCDPGDSGCIAFKGVPSCNPYTGQNCHHDPPKEVDPPATCDPSTGRNCHPHERSNIVTERATQACDPEKQECGSDEEPDCDPLQDPDCLSHPKRSDDEDGPYGCDPDDTGCIIFKNKPSCNPFTDPNCPVHERRGVVLKGKGPYGCDPDDGACITFKGKPSCNPFTDPHCPIHERSNVDTRGLRIPACDPEFDPTCGFAFCDPKDPGCKRSEVINEPVKARLCDDEDDPDCGHEEGPDCNPVLDPDCKIHPKRSEAVNKRLEALVCDPEFDPDCAPPCNPWEDPSCRSNGKRSEVVSKRLEAPPLTPYCDPQKDPLCPHSQQERAVGGPGRKKEGSLICMRGYTPECRTKEEWDKFFGHKRALSGASPPRGPHRPLLCVPGRNRECNEHNMGGIGKGPHGR